MEETAAIVRTINRNSSLKNEMTTELEKRIDNYRNQTQEFDQQFTSERARENLETFERESTMKRNVDRTGKYKSELVNGSGWLGPITSFYDKNKRERNVKKFDNEFNERVYQNMMRQLETENPEKYKKTTEVTNESEE